MTEKLYYKDSHKQEFEATVIKQLNVNGAYHILLDQTIFFPEGGGQSSDTGSLNDIPVTYVYEKEECIYHVAASPIEPGTKVRGTIDYEERFSKMQQHSGEHIVSGLIHKHFGLDNVGFHLGKDYVTMDFNGELTTENLRFIELLANQAVVKNIKILELYPKKEELASIEYRSKIEIEGQVRIVEIPGYDRCACCAPHVTYTGEIGLIKLIASEKYKGGTRVSMLCGFRALSDYNRKEESVNKVSVLLSAKSDEITEAVTRLKDEVYRLNGKINALMDVQVEEAIGRVTGTQKVELYFEDSLDINAMRKFVNGAMEKCDGISGAFSKNEKGEYRYILGSRSMDVRDICKALNNEFSGKGGGKPEMVQGSLSGEKADIMNFLQTYISV